MKERYEYKFLFVLQEMKIIDKIVYSYLISDITSECVIRNTSITVIYKILLRTWN